MIYCDFNKKKPANQTRVAASGLVFEKAAIFFSAPSTFMLPEKKFKYFERDGEILSLRKSNKNAHNPRTHLFFLTQGFAIYSFFCLKDPPVKIQNADISGFCDGGVLNTEFFLTH